VAGDDGAVGNAGLQAVGHLAKDFVAGGGAEEVVDRLETIEIGDADGEGRRIVGALGRDLGDAIAHAIAVTKPGQRVGISHRLKLILANRHQRHICRHHHSDPELPQCRQNGREVLKIR
jgi:hypothetical protein